MNITIRRLIEGAKKAEGLAVIIDVFRAFSLECYLFAAGAAGIRPVRSIEETFAWRKKDPECLLIGERHGRMIEGCDLGNSPSSSNCVISSLVRFSSAARYFPFSVWNNSFFSFSTVW